MADRLGQLRHASRSSASGNFHNKSRLWPSRLQHPGRGPPLTLCSRLPTGERGRLAAHLHGHWEHPQKAVLHGTQEVLTAG